MDGHCVDSGRLFSTAGAPAFVRTPWDMSWVCRETHPPWQETLLTAALCPGGTQGSSGWLQVRSGLGKGWPLLGRGSDLGRGVRRRHRVNSSDSKWLFGPTGISSSTPAAQRGSHSPAQHQLHCRTQTSPRGLPGTQTCGMFWPNTHLVPPGRCGPAGDWPQQTPRAHMGHSPQWRPVRAGQTCCQGHFGENAGVCRVTEGYIRPKFGVEKWLTGGKSMHSMISFWKKNL